VDPVGAVRPPKGKTDVMSFFRSSVKRISPDRPAAVNGILRLGECRPGQGGRIARLDLQGPVAQRLMEMGFIEGIDVRVVRAAPLGDPIEVRLHDYDVSIRRSEAFHVELEP